MSDTITLQCPACSAERTVPWTPGYPQGAVVMVVHCDAHGSVDAEPKYFDDKGRRIDLQIFPCEQNSPEWDGARAGVVTASEFHTVKAQGRGGGESVTRRKYMLRLVGERIGGVSPFERYMNGNMQRGHEYEPEARELYQIVTGHEVERVGFLRRGDIGCSPDSLIGKDGMLEIKTKIYELHLECLLKDEVPAEHIPQLQGNLLVSARQWIDFCSYSCGLPIFVKRVCRDDKYIAMLRVEIDRFLAELREMEQRVRRMAA